MVMVELPELYKRRDPKEPGRETKEMYEDKLFSWMRRRFRTQKRKIGEALGRVLPQKQVEGWYDRLDDDAYWDDDETDAAIVALFYGMLMEGQQIFQLGVDIGIEWGGYNEWAVRQAREQFLGFITGIDDYTKAALREALESFARLPGFTIKDVMASLPFDGYRAQRIAVTETTRMFALAEQTALAELQLQFPGLEVTKTWYTNADDIVCEICRPMDGQTVAGDGMFLTDEGIYIMGPPAHVNCRCWMIGSVA